MAKTIKTSINGPFTLSATDNPLLITIAGTITSTSGDGIDGDASAAWTITNRGDILAPNGTGVALAGAGSVTNSGLIATGGKGVYIQGAGSVQNSGTILTQGGRGAVVILGDGTVTNAAGAAITGLGYGVYLDSSGTVTNSGSIAGLLLGGVFIQGSGSVINRAGGVISGNTVETGGGLLTEGVNLGSGTITNKGTISGQVGAAVAGSGAVTNTLGAAIQGSNAGVVIDGSAAVVSNAGMISGQKDFGIFLGSSGTITNLAGGSISGGADGVHGFGAAAITNSAGGIMSGGTGYGVWIASGTVRNAGAISGYKDGVYSGGAADVTNNAGGSISARSSIVNRRNGNLDLYDGIEIASGTVTNAGSISGFAAGVRIKGAGTVRNSRSIFGDFEGIYITGAGSVTNSGTVSGGTVSANYPGGIGIVDRGNLSLTNTGTVLAQGNYSLGLLTWGSATVTNSGVIYGFGAGAQIHGGTLTNARGGTISSQNFGVFVDGGAAGTVTNAGTIAGGLANGASVLFSGQGSRLIVDPGAVFIGQVEDGLFNALNDTIELARGTGTISGIGSQFTGFGTLQVDTGANWTLNGANTIGTVLNDGTTGLAGSLTVGTSIDPTSTGLFQLAASSVLEVAAATGVSSKMSFSSGSELIVDQFASFGQNVGSLSYAGPLLEHFGAGATVDLKDFSYGTGVFISTLTSSGILELTNSASQQADLAFQKSSLGSGTFHFALDVGTGVLVTRG